MQKSDPRIPLETWQRRDVLKHGFVGGLGLSLSGLTWAREVAANTASAVTFPAKIRSCIIVFYYGGPSHIDTYDPKPQAPKEVRGEFQTISTSVPGLTISEHLPRMSRLMHKVALVRSMHHKNTLHDSASTEALTGRQSPTGDREEFAPIRQYFPCYGSALTCMRRNVQTDLPHSALPYVFHNVVDTPCQGGGFLGSAYDPLQISVNAQDKSYSIGDLALGPDQTPLRVGQRRELLTSLEQRILASSDLGAASGPLRRFYEKAYDLLGSKTLQRALDLSEESPETRARYGFDPDPSSVGEGGGGGNGAEMGYARQMRGQNLLLARRLVERGAPFVNVYDFRQQGQNWDAHFKCFNQHKKTLLPIADRSLAAMIEDLDERGLLDSTLVVAMGEFGRTPQINKEGGRDHWGNCYTILLAGGGVKGGTVFGASDRIGAHPAVDPVSPADLAATIYWRFGVDPATEMRDTVGRPFKLADGLPITQIFG